MSSLENIATIVTHGRNFHADDCVADGTLKLIKPELETIRSDLSMFELEGDLEFDRGGVYSHALKQYDHHQDGGADFRENGVPYASAGLIWKHYSNELCSPEVAQIVDKEFIEQIDGVDSGYFREKYKLGEGLCVSGVYSKLNPVWTEIETVDQKFDEASKISQEFLLAYMNKAQMSLEGRTVNETFTGNEALACALLATQNPNLTNEELLSKIRAEYGKTDSIVCPDMNPVYNIWNKDIKRTYRAKHQKKLEKHFINRITQGKSKETREILMMNQLLEAYNYSNNSFYNNFSKAVDLSKKVLKNFVDEISSSSKAHAIVKRAVENQTNPNVLVLDSYCPWRPHVAGMENESKFVIHPGNFGDAFYVSGVPDIKNKSKSRGVMPIEFRGLKDKELQEVSGIGDINFCHRTKPLAGAKTLKGAKRIAKKALQVMKRKDVIPL